MFLFGVVVGTFIGAYLTFAYLTRSFKIKF